MSSPENLITHAMYEVRPHPSKSQGRWAVQPRSRLDVDFPGRVRGRTDNGQGVQVVVKLVGKENP